MSAPNLYADTVSKGWLKFQDSCDWVHKKIKRKVEFDFYIGYQPSDGPVMEADPRYVAPLDACLAIIEEKGTLSWVDYLSVRI